MVAGGAGAVFLGMAARDSADLGRPVSQDPFTGMLVASSSKTTPQDFDIPERPYFESMAQLLREDYVDPIADESKLVSGAARGIVLSLNDPNSIYMDKDEFRVFQSMRQGEYEGIGAELVYSYTKTTEEDLKNFPRLQVTVVVPGGPADKAGVKSGDIIESVNGHWIVDPDTIVKFRKIAREVEKDKSKEPEFKKLRNELRKKSETSMMPARARDLLMLGTTGSVKASWLNSGQSKNADMTRQKSVVKAVNAEGGAIKLQMINGVAEALTTVLPADGVATIDLRNNSSLDVALTRDVLSVLAPAGDYGVMKSIKGEEPFTIAKGQAKAKKLVLIVDNSTSGGAAILAQALASKKLATIQGTPVKRMYAAEVVKLPKGDGFTLVRAEYLTAGTSKAKVVAENAVDQPLKNFGGKK